MRMRRTEGDDERKELNVGFGHRARAKDSFDRIIVISVGFILRRCFGVSFYKGRIIYGDRIKSQRRFSLCSLAKHGREFSSVVSRRFYNKFVLVRDSGLCLFAEESLQQTNQNLAETSCIKASGL